MQHLHVPVWQIGLINGDQDNQRGFGVTNLENPLPVNDATLFQIGSITTEPFTATMAMRPNERALLDL